MRLGFDIDIVEFCLLNSIRARRISMFHKMNEIRLICRRYIIQRQAETAMSCCNSICRNKDIILIARHIHMAVCIDMPLNHLTCFLVIKDKGIMRIHVYIERKVLKLIMVNASVHFHFIALYIRQMDVREENSGCIHHDSIMRNDIPCAGPWQAKRRVESRTTEKDINALTLRTAHNDTSRTIAA